MQMFFIIKGTRHDAEIGAMKRKIDCTIDAESPGMQVYCYAPMSEKNKIINWYCEDAGIAKQAAPGECLWYTERP